MAWIGAVVGAASAYMSSREQKKAAEAASKPRESVQTSTPYMNEYISKLVPYILSQQQNVFESRMKGYGLNPGDFSPIAQMLSGISPNYTGIGDAGTSGSNYGQQYNPFSSGYGTPRTAAQNAAMRDEVRGLRSGMEFEGMHGARSSFGGSPALSQPSAPTVPLNLSSQRGGSGRDYLLEMLGGGAAGGQA